MFEKLMTLPLSELREIAKTRGIARVTGVKKADLARAIVDTIETPVEAPAEPKAAGAPAAPAPMTAAPAAVTAEAAETDEVSNPARKTAKPSGSDSDSAAKTTEPSGSDSAFAPEAVEASDTSESAEPDSAPDSTEDSESSESAEASESSESGSESAPAFRYEQNARGRYQRRDYREPRPVTPPSEGEKATGYFEILPEGYGFLRSSLNFQPNPNDIFISNPQIRRFNIKNGDVVTGIKRANSMADKNPSLVYINDINGFPPEEAISRQPFMSLTPIFPDKRIPLSGEGSTAMRIVDLISPIGKGQRGMIVSPPKAGKTTLLKQIANSVIRTNPEIYLIILLIDERPEEVTDMRESIKGPHVEIIASTFDEHPSRHVKVSEMVLERAKRLVEHKQDVMILLDSITRLTRAYNQTVDQSGRTLSGGLDPAALYMPKKFFGAARNLREGGSLTILATALVDTGSRMDDVVFEEFKGTGNMELVLDRKLQEKRIFPAIDIVKSGTRRDDLLLTRDEQEALDQVHRLSAGAKGEDNLEKLLDLFTHTKNNREFMFLLKKKSF